MLNLTNDIIAFESGEMEQDEVLNFFAKLIKTGLAWQLQGSYGRAAHDFIQSGQISPRGEVL